MHDSEHPRKLRKFVTQHKFGFGGWWANATVPETVAANKDGLLRVMEVADNIAGVVVTYDKMTRTYTLGAWGETLAAAEVALQAAVGYALPGYHL